MTTVASSQPKQNIEPSRDSARFRHGNVTRRAGNVNTKLGPVRIVELIAEGDQFVGHFKCSGTHRGEWLGMSATGRRFEGIDEIYIFRILTASSSRHSVSRTT